MRDTVATRRERARRARHANGAGHGAPASERVGESEGRSLLDRLQIDARRVAVERNFVVVKRDAYPTTTVDEGDQVEIVNFVGGG